MAFILQRGVHRRANTLSRHKYLAGEQGRSLNPEGGSVDQLVAGYVHTHREDRWFSTTQFPGCHAGGNVGEAERADGGQGV